MQYAQEDISPVKKKIVITVPVEECEAALGAAIAMYRSNLTLDGFRKGKVPSSLVEKRFQKEIVHEATTDLVNVHINEVIDSTKLAPVSRIDFDGGEIERGKEFVYSISFEVMPQFDLPPYEGFAVEQEEAVVDEAEIDAVIDRVRGNMAETVDVAEARKPGDGDIAVVDFEAFDDQGTPIPGIKADNFQITIGEGQTIADFETLIRDLTPDETKEAPCAFPADFFNPEFAGKTVSMKATLKGIKQKKLPEADDAFAKKAGNFESMEKLRESVRESYMKSRSDLHKSEAQRKILDGLLKLVEFPVPDSMVAQHLNGMVGDVVEKLERQGKGLAAIGKTEDDLRTDFQAEAELRARSQILLLTVGRTEKLEVTEGEVDLALHRLSAQAGQDFAAVKEYYSRNNLLFALRDRLLADKAMDLIHQKAAVTMVPPKKKDDEAKSEAAE